MPGSDTSLILGTAPTQIFYGLVGHFIHTVNSRLADTPLLRTVCKFPAETTMKCIEITLTITDSRFYGIADTSCGPQQTFLLLLSLQRTPWTYFSACG